MHKPKPDPDPVRCACGRERSAAAAATYTCSTGRYLFSRCVCGAEWTEQLDQVDHSEPVSLDEVLEVHERLATFSGNLNELVGVKPAT